MNNKTIRVDFDVRSDLYNLYIQDNSCWGIAKDLPAVIEITLPGFKTPFKSYFSKKDTSYDSISLGLVCGDDNCENIELPDGIYNILLKASPDIFRQEYFYLKSDILEKDMNLAFLRVLDESCDDNCKRDILHAKFLLQVAEAALSKNDIKLSAEYYKLSENIVKKIKNCKSCR